MIRTPLAVMLLVLVALCAAPGALARTPPRVQLLSRSLSGGFPNGPSHDGAISQDRQNARYAAFDSDASDIVRGDSNGTTDVFLVRRAQPINLDAPPWHPGPVSLISRALGGGPADGPSYLPDIDGEQTHAPRCVAFVSRASNLVAGDTNGVADAFIYHLHTGEIRRVSLGSSGQQANGATYEVKVDGHCDRVAFVSDATNLVPGTPPGVKQVYVRMLDGDRDNHGLSGKSYLASAADDGAPGNADSTQISFARSGGGCGRQHRCGDFSGEAVFFASQASNLVPGDVNGASDVFERAFPRRFVYAHVRHVRTVIKGVGPLQFSTRLISAAAGRGAGNGPSDSPATTPSGDFVAFRTAATNLIPGDGNGMADVVRLNTLSGQLDPISRTTGGRLGNGPSGEPAIGRTGQDVVFASGASLDPNDRNCSGDVYHLDVPHDRQILTSLDAQNRVPNYVFGSRAPCPRVIAAPSVNPAVSYYVNYAVWESSWPFMDVPLALRRFGAIGNDRAAQLSAQPALHQVYLRYLSPR